ncbi:hypothetical protein D3P08_00780 [Paenibacillus nanensis]|uniref:Uncharacterized protein n=1 Tax=Paenibacillus nanensis TaxID=393251 RepID=A0A3A1VI74_9BACL|nr:hypothetical protein D3P08_00780 [Paenibacillus nanensis]
MGSSNNSTMIFAGMAGGDAMLGLRIPGACASPACTRECSVLTGVYARSGLKPCNRTLLEKGVTEAEEEWKDREQACPRRQAETLLRTFP